MQTADCINKLKKENHIISIDIKQPKTYEVLRIKVETTITNKVLKYF